MAVNATMPDQKPILLIEWFTSFCLHKGIWAGLSFPMMDAGRRRDIGHVQILLALF